MKFGNQNKSNMLIMNILIETDDLDRKLDWWPWPKTELCSNFYEIWHLEQIENGDYEYSTWNWWSWSKITDSGKFGPNTEIFSNFYEIWLLQQIEHAYYEYNISQCLEHLRDYKLRMIVGSEHGIIIQTITVPTIVPCSEWL